MSEHERKRLVVGMTGASGPVYGIRLLEVLRRIPEREVHLVMTNPAKLNVNVESDLTVAEVEGLADVVQDWSRSTEQAGRLSDSGRSLRWAPRADLTGRHRNAPRARCELATWPLASTAWSAPPGPASARPVSAAPSGAS